MQLREAKQPEWDLCFSDDKEDEKRGCIGHVRIDFGRNGNEWWHTWWPHQESMVTPEFIKDLNLVIDGIHRSGPLQNLSTMKKFCYAHPEAKMGDCWDGDAYCFMAEGEQFTYALRLSFTGYHIYAYAYDAEILRHYLDPAYQPKYTLMEVKQRGMTAYIEARNIQNALQAARIVRTHLKAGNCLKPLEDEFLGPVLDAEEYGRQLSGWKTEPCVRGTISIDMDGRTFSFEDRDNPWAEYSLRHISSAVYRADRKRVLDPLDRWDIFSKSIAGHELTQNQGVNMTP